MTLTLDLHLPRRRDLGSWALFSGDGRYRHMLRRRWGMGPLVGWIGLNPSTASGHREDATSRRFHSFSAGFGFSGYTVANLYDAVSTDPRRIAYMADPRSPVNDLYLNWLAAVHDLIVFAWGAGADPAHARAVASRIWQSRVRRGGSVAVLGWTANGQPRHPLYLRSDTPLHTLTAGHPGGFVDVDGRWSQLLADPTGLDEDPRSQNRSPRCSASPSGLSEPLLVPYRTGVPTS
ncbi:DUF1643 domain-containing protein [Mycobacterium talmoniae]|uniref:DUF1643 domain-containing protein n=1 Tax=Mycobacterium talmoniae TaxID=1858794 RepID=UPI0009F4F53E|nr:DUF1643 domain-containing protein [Mycobacterium talmoniae]